MLYTLAEARTLCGPYVGTGTCNTTSIDACVNEAIERLCDLEPWLQLLRKIQIRVCNECFALPYQVEKLEWVTLDGTPGSVFAQPYQFLSSGPGDLDYRSAGSGFQHLMDLGDHWPIFYDIPKCVTISNVETAISGLGVVAFSTAASDRDKEMTIEGFNGSAEEILTAGVRGEVIKIRVWDGGVEGVIRGPWSTGAMLSTNLFSDVTRVRKPATDGYVTLLAVDPSINYVYTLAKYHPRETLPQYRRYRVVNKVVETATRILALARLRALPLVDPSDILPIDSLQAVKLMVMAIREENQGNLEGAVAFQEQARRVLGKRQEASAPQGGGPQVLDVAHATSLGRYTNRRKMIL